MILRGAQGESASHDDFRAAFLAQVHELLQVGYARLDAPSLSAEDETAITGRLAKAIDDFLNDPHSPDWVALYGIYDDPPVNDGTRTGRRRNRVDIRLVSSVTRPRPAFEFEAKRLGPGHSVQDYLGTDGLGCFLDGRYAREHDSAGMLGYVQQDDESQWQTRIRQKLESVPTQYQLVGKHCMQASPFAAGPRHSYTSLHKRTATLPEIRIYHTLLRFCTK